MRATEQRHHGEQEQKVSEFNWSRGHIERDRRHSHWNRDDAWSECEQRSRIADMGQVIWGVERCGDCLTGQDRWLDVRQVLLTRQDWPSGGGRAILEGIYGFDLTEMNRFGLCIAEGSRRGCKVEG